MKKFINDYNTTLKYLQDIVNDDEINFQCDRLLRNIILLLFKQSKGYLNSKSYFRDVIENQNIDKINNTILLQLNKITYTFRNQYTIDFLKNLIKKDENVLKNMINTFDEYNYSLVESLSKDIISPDIFSLIHENNLLNRKETGTVYTPLDIVEFMIKNSIFEYLKSFVDINYYNSLQAFIIFNDIQEEFMIKYKTTLDLALSKMKIIDPSMGSGNFIIPFINIYAKIKEMLNEKNHDYNKINNYIYCIKNVIAGLDVDSDAINIAKHRIYLLLMDIANIDEMKLDITKPLNFTRTDSITFGITTNNIYDIVIGNPPYIRTEYIDADYKKKYLSKHYDSYNGRADLLIYFYELGYKLVKQNGIVSLIASNSWTRAGYGKEFRNFLLQNTQILNYIDFNGIKVFKNVTVNVAILSFKKI